MNMSKKQYNYFQKVFNRFRDFIYSDFLTFNKQDIFFLKILRFFYTIIRVFYAKHCLRQGAALAYASLLSIFPLVAVLFFLVPIFISSESSQLQVQQTILSFLIPGSSEDKRTSSALHISSQTQQKRDSDTQASLHDDNNEKSYLQSKNVENEGEYFESQLQSYFKHYRVEVAKLKAIGIIGTIIVAIILFITVEQSFAMIWGVKKRPFLKSFTLFTGVIFWIPLLIGLSLYFSAEISSRVSIVGRKIDLLLPLFLTFAALVFAYALIPNTKVKFSWAMFGAFISSIFWEIAKNIFNRFILSSTNYQNLFNAVGAIPYLLIWLYISWLIILCGVVLTYCGQNLKILLYEDISKGKKLINPSLIVLILFIIADRWERGLKGASLEVIKSCCPINTDDLQSHLEFLIDHEIIQMIPDEEVFILIKDPEKIHLKDFLLFKKYLHEVFYYEDSRASRIISEISNADSHLAALMGNKTLRNLLIEGKH